MSWVATHEIWSLQVQVEGPLVQWVQGMEGGEGEGREKWIQKRGKVGWDPSFQVK